MFSLFLRQFTCPLPLADSLHLSRLRAGLSHMEFSNRSSLRAQGPITPGLESEKRPLLECRSESLRRRDERFALTLGSLRSQGRPAERLCEATTDQRTAQFSHMRFPCPQAGEGAQAPSWTQFDLVSSRTRTEVRWTHSAYSVLCPISALSY